MQRLCSFNIVGEKVALGPLRKDLVPLYARWFNDFRTLRMLGPMPRPLALEQEEQWYKRAITRGDAVIAFTIYEKATRRPIGNTGLHDIDHRNRTALFGITIGESDARGKGYGTEATQLMLDFAFTVQGLHNVMLHSSTNTTSPAFAHTRKPASKNSAADASATSWVASTLGLDPHGVPGYRVGPKPGAGGDF